MGGEHHSGAEGDEVCVSVGDAAERAGFCRVDCGDALESVPRRVYGLQADAAAALSVSGGEPGDFPGGGRQERVSGRRVQQGDWGARGRGRAGESEECEGCEGCEGCERRQQRGRPAVGCEQADQHDHGAQPGSGHHLFVFEERVRVVGGSGGCVGGEYGGGEADGARDLRQRGRGAEQGGPQAARGGEYHQADRAGGRRASLGDVADLERADGDPVPGGADQGAVCDRDVLDRAQHAGQDGGVHACEEV